MKKVLLLIASNGFQPHEYSVTRAELEKAEIQVITGSDLLCDAVGSDESVQKIDVELKEVEANNFDGIFWIGGPGALSCLDNQESNRIANEAMLLQKPYGAICISPRILAKAHVMTGKHATGWNEDNELPQIFSENNVVYTPEPVVIDENLITADGPSSAELFGRAIAQTLMGL
ncbi:MAG: hypothetical protein COV59_04685 [Candidatus Magasanikbacteria bacterium CG11_big_fil_rev_8_21_14_0_20_39_34]|uniref:DJ-1/PfpI domain-containing protein n=1 Tax=Candidatus Magasanikbacteria bacterium CG11_big_fil_rev_8_21_14_0_20_39_34 TaxID=1974653 RepID=A0A2H0N4D6_9BACT|nr:MAG: hypothetical protein COV59_04685 [Candidatus Magasanikbacteria bacterium CG11_big_fil_rev_8_21_14_0_20_39_34]